MTHTYILDGAKILREVWGDNELIPLYDNEDSVCGIIYNDHPFYFQKNLQGDVIAVTDWAGLTVARYTYDAWGKCTIIEDTSDHNIATINPFRYRAYYYDAEIQMYYLQSRYYDPKMGQFINGDDVTYLENSEGVLVSHLFAYCENDPISRVDHGGNSCVDVFFKVATIIKASQNYKYNKQKKREVSGTVYGQKSVDMKFASTTVAEAGCGIVAAHNALIALKKGKKLSEIVYYFDERNAILGDLWSAPFWDVAGCVKKYAGVSSKTTLFPKTCDSAIKKSKNKMGVIAFKWHYFFAKWDSKKEMFLVYNYYSADTKRREYPSIDKELENTEKLCLITF